MADLYGRDREIKLVQDFLDRLFAGDTPRSRQVPVLVFTGPRGSGKTALLTELARQLDQQAPYAQLDFEAMQSWSVLQLLSLLVFELNRRCGEYGSLPFPRFITGHLIISRKLDDTDPTLAIAQVDAALQEYRRVDKAREFLTETAVDVVGVVHPGADRVPGVRGAAKVLSELVLNGLRSWRGGRRLFLGVGQDWYQHQDVGLQQDSLAALVSLNRQAARPDLYDNEGEVGELLWAAFLADLRDGFRRGKRAGERSLNCALLLDNADTEIGRRFLDGLKRAREQHAAFAPDDPDPLTVVATSRGPVSMSITEENATLAAFPQASYEDSGRRPDRTWYPVLLGNLTKAEVGNMVKARVPQMGLNQRITTAVHWFTDGHPGSVRILLNAIAQRPVERKDLRVVLEAQEPDVLEDEPIAVEQRLLRQFHVGLPQDGYNDLITLSAASDRNRALRLADHSGLLTSLEVDRTLILGPEFWTEPGPMVPALRRLLLRQLAAREPTDLASWAKVHSWLRDAHAEARDEVRERYHALALGSAENVESVSHWLTGLLPELDIHEWLGRLATVTRAPNMLDHSISAMEYVRELAPDPADHVARLVAARWIAEEPLAAGDLYSLYLEIAAAYEAIASRSEVLRHEADRYRAAAERYRPGRLHDQPDLR